MLAYETLFIIFLQYHVLELERRPSWTTITIQVRSSSLFRCRYSLVAPQVPLYL